MNFQKILLTNLFLLFLMSVCGEIVLQVDQSDFARNEPNDMLQMIDPTNIEVSYDRDNLYIHAIMTKNEDMITGASVNYETYQTADYLRVQIVVSLKDRFSYIYYAYPNGSLLDGVRKSDLNISNDWDSNYSYKSSFTENEWIVDFTIPFNDLNYPNKDVHNWKLAFSRAYTKKYHLYSGPYSDIKMKGNYFDKGFDIVLSDIVRSKLNITTRGYSSYLHDNLTQDSKYGLKHSGFDLAYNPSSALNFKTSVNPDYSEVPLDYEQDIYNLEFAPYLNENRYFFTEDYDIFDFPSYMFYTRHIQQPEIAAKFTGNNQNLSYGVLYAKDKKLTDDGYVYNTGNQYVVANVKPKGDYWSVQLSTLNRFNPHNDYTNSVLQINPIVYVSDNNRLEIDTYLSTNKTEKEKTINGIDFSLKHNYYAPKYDLMTAINSSSKNFTADMGRIDETNYTLISTCFDYRFDISKLRYLGLETWLDYSFFNKNGDKKSLSATSYFTVSTMNGFKADSELQFKQEEYEGKIFNEPDIRQTLLWSNYDNLSFSFAAAFGKSLIYSLNDTYKLFNTRIDGQYTFKERYALSLSLTTMNYLGLDEFEKEMFDNEYQYLNADLTMNIGKMLKSTTGIRYNNYSGNYTVNGVLFNYTDHLGVYANLLFKFNKYIELSGGYSYGADTINKKTDEIHNNFWSKLMVEYAF
ncbi:MAG: hypothetical protein WC155_01725 [Candidatus Cloacimonadales bacterium]